MYEFPDKRKNQTVEPVALRNEFRITNLIVLYYNRFAPKFRYAGERHNFYEFYYVAEGEMAITVSGKTHVAGEGEYILVPPMLWHSMEPHKCYATGVSLSFDAENYATEMFGGKLSGFCKQLLTNILNIYAKNCNESEFRPIIFSEKNYDEEKDYAYGQALRANIELLTLNVLQEHKQDERRKTAPEKKYSPLAQSTLLYLKNHFKENPSLQQIADAQNYSVPHVCRVFKQNYNESIVNYLTKLKIDEAVKLIEQNNMSLREISDYLGFDNVAYFTRIFKKHTGTTPSAYRKFAVWAHILNSKYLPKDLKL